MQNPSSIHTTSLPSAERRGPGRRDYWYAAVCGLVTVAAILAADPFPNLPFNDDWSYSFTVRQLLATGHLRYNGWASASLVAQVYWGALWTKLLGFSFPVLRASTVPFAAAAVAVVYLLGRAATLSVKQSFFAALLLGLSPLFLPLAPTFMTDVPGLFCIVWSLYGLVRSAAATSSGRAAAWVSAATAVAVVGGTGRQIVWVVPLSVLPYLAWLWRADRARAGVAAVWWVLTLATAVLTMRWFAAQPYSIPEASMLADLRAAVHNPFHFVMTVLAMVLTLVWMMLPLTIGRLADWKGGTGLIATFVLLLVVTVVSVRRQYATAPWMDNTLDASGVMGRSELSGVRAVVLTVPVRIAIAVVVFAVLSVLAASTAKWLSRPLSADRGLWRLISAPRPDEIGIVIGGIFAAAYWTLLLPRCAQDMVFDRYILPLIPCVSIPLLLWQGRRKLRFYNWALLVVYAGYGIAITQEISGLARARLAGIQRLRDAGVPPLEIDAGLEYDYWAQLQYGSGYINDTRLQNPKGAYDPLQGPTPSLQARYRLEYDPAVDTEPTRFGEVGYFSLLPPFHRHVLIDAFRDPWWLDPVKTATRPARVDRRISGIRAGGH